MRLDRRTFLVLAGLIAAAPAAFAGVRIGFPLRLASVRIGPTGFIAQRSAEQAAWEAMTVRLGRLVENLEPLQPSNMLGQRAPELDGGASCALAARTMAAGAGFSHVLLYAIDDGRDTKKRGWLDTCFAALRSPFAPGKSALGEAHLLSVDGGAPILSVTADAPPRGWLLSSRDPAAETLTQLTQLVERRIQLLARADFDAERSIAD